jgi:hypothetical protein
MNGIKRRASNQFRIKKPLKIQYASQEEVDLVTDEVLRKHSQVFELLAKR